MKIYPQKLSRSFIKHLTFFVLLPFTAILLLLLYFSNLEFKKQSAQVNEQLSEQITHHLSQNLKLVQNLADTVIQNPQLLNFFEKPYTQRIDLDYYNSVIYNSVSLSNSFSSDLQLRIYLKNNSIPIGHDIFFHLDDLNGFTEILDFYHSEKKSLWLDGNSISDSAHSTHKLFAKNYYCYLEKIIFQNNDLGLVLIQMPKKLLYDFRQEKGLSYSFQTQPQYILYDFTDSLPKENNPELSKLSGIFFSQGKIYHSTFYPKFPFNILVVTAASKQQIYFLALILVSIGFIIIAFFLFIRYIQKLIHDITYCLNAMDYSIENQFKYPLSLERKDEISVIAARINYLLERIRFFMDINVKQQLMNKEAQLIALQHQINPHFLYNTMEIFSSKMELAGLYKESDAISSFCQILRYNINSNSLLVTIGDELNQVKNYLKIQSLRKIDISLEVTICPELLSHRMIKFILQPFVENCVKYRRNHALLKIKISARLEDDIIHFSITDNGMGIEPETLLQLNKRFSGGDPILNHNSQEIGLDNINARLKLFYGEKHRISILPCSEGACLTFAIKANLPA